MVQAELVAFHHVLVGERLAYHQSHILQDQQHGRDYLLVGVQGVHLHCCRHYPHLDHRHQWEESLQWQNGSMQLPEKA
jgi:hypothetical protein